MTSVQNLIKRLFPYKIITHRLSDLHNQLLQQNIDKNDIFLSIEKENKSRQFCCLSIEELLRLFECCPTTERTLYESISINKPVRTYIDFEYLIDKNLNIQNHYIGPMCCLKVLYYFLNAPDDTINTVESYIENILKQFLVLEASTTEKISYHFINANPSILFESISSLGIFIKAIIRFLLLAIVQHKCAMFNMDIPIEQFNNASNLTIQLVPFIHTLRNHCRQCNTSIPYVSIADIAYLLVQNRGNEWTLAIDTNVYSNNQQFRLFNCVKYGKNNPLVPSTTFPFHYQLEYSSHNLLKKSLITYMEDDHIPKVYLNGDKFDINLSSISNRIATFSYNLININLINQHIKPLTFSKPSTNASKSHTPQNLIHLNKINHLNSSVKDIQLFLNFVENIVTSEPSYQGYVHTCVRGIYNKDLLFFNIAEHEKRGCLVPLHNVNDQIKSIFGISMSSGERLKKETRKQKREIIEKQNELIHLQKKLNQEQQEKEDAVIQATVRIQNPYPRSSSSSSSSVTTPFNFTLTIFVLIDESLRKCDHSSHPPVTLKTKKVLVQTKEGFVHLKMVW
ncbi:unnamed protein product [Rotaria socialis]